MPQWLGSAILTARAKRTLKLGSIGAATTLGVLGVAQVACAEPVYQNSYQNDTSISYFQAASEAADRRDISALYNYEQMMNGGIFAMYPAYWRLSSDINSQSAASVA